MASERQLKIHCIQHVPFEGPAFIKQWADQKGHQVSYTLLYETDKFPEPGEFDWLVIMGGPMGVNDDGIYSWLAAEKAFIKQAIEQSKIVIGICLGAQIIASVLGAGVKPGKHKEIGWFPVKFDISAAKKAGLDFLPRELTVFHWHGDTFDIPQGAVHLASSDGCNNQAFIYRDRVLALQFHFEMDRQALEQIIHHGKDELITDIYVHCADEIIHKSKLTLETNKVMQRILDFFESQCFLIR